MKILSKSFQAPSEICVDVKMGNSTMWNATRVAWSNRFYACKKYEDDHEK